MRPLVAYYSKSGNTKKVAKAIAKELSADLDEIFDQKSRKGIINFIKSGRDALKKIPTEIVFSKNPADYGLVLVGTPVWAGSLPPAVRTYLSQNKEKIKKFALFATSGSGDNKNLPSLAEEALGVKVSGYIEFKDETVQNPNLKNIVKEFTKKLI